MLSKLILKILGLKIFNLKLLVMKIGVLFIFGGWVVLIPGAFGDTIHLKSGRIVRVEKAWEENGQIRCEMYGATIGYNKADVLRIEKDDWQPETEEEAERPAVKKIAPDLFQTDIRKVIGMLREPSGKNFAIDPDVTGSVTLTIEEPVPWTEVLDLVLKMNGLEKEFFGPDTIRIYRR